MLKQYGITKLGHEGYDMLVLSTYRKKDYVVSPSKSNKDLRPQNSDLSLWINVHPASWPQETGWKVGEAKGQSKCVNMAEKEGHKTSKDDRWVDGVSAFSLSHKKSRIGFVQGIELRKFYWLEAWNKLYGRSGDRKPFWACTCWMWDPGSVWPHCPIVGSWDHGHISPLCEVGFKNHDSHYVGPSSLWP